MHNNPDTDNGNTVNFPFASDECGDTMWDAVLAQYEPAGVWPASAESILNAAVHA